MTTLGALIAPIFLTENWRDHGEKQWQLASCFCILNAQGEHSVAEIIPFLRSSADSLGFRYNLKDNKVRGKYLLFNCGSKQL